MCFIVHLYCYHCPADAAMRSEVLHFNLWWSSCLCTFIPLFFPSKYKVMKHEMQTVDNDWMSLWNTLWWNTSAFSEQPGHIGNQYKIYENISLQHIFKAVDWTLNNLFTSPSLFMPPYVLTPVQLCEHYRGLFITAGVSLVGDTP